MTEQKKRENAIKGLQILRTWCAVDPHYGRGLSVDECNKAVAWLDDALALLKAQEQKRPDCEAANYDGGGCLGYGHSENDDECLETTAI